jgi:hypothetical protein
LKASAFAGRFLASLLGVCFISPMSIAFKEWQVICDALASGRQSILLRKGGIHEGRSGFCFAHRSFLLFPTKFHAQIDHVREGHFTPQKEWQVGDSFTITHHAQALFAVTLTDWAQVEALQPYHIYTEATLRERFDWEGKGMASGSIHLALVRVSEITPSIDLTYDTRFGGCRSWVEIPDENPERLENAHNVIGQDAFSTLFERISAVAGVDVTH